MKNKVFYYGYRAISKGMIFATISCLYGCGHTQKTSKVSPNIIVIFTDDQGYGDLGCYGSPNIHTPNIDLMAAGGMRFTSFYAAPFCGPSRAQLLTGCYPPRVGHARNPGPSSPYGLNPNELTIAEVLQNQGYATKCIGKWHLGDAPEFLPTQQGFDSYFGIPYSNDMWKYHPNMPPKMDEDSLMLAIRSRATYTGFAGQGSYYPLGKGFPNDLPLMIDEEIIELNPDQQQLTDRYTESALDFITKQNKNPFFLYLAFSMPHVPLFVSEKYAGKSYRGLYGDAIMELDGSVGRIMGLIKDLGLDNNTLIIYTSDNGPWLQYGIDGGSAGPLRAGKGTLYEGGIRVPAIFRWPGKIPSGSISGLLSGNLDIFPTLVGLAGVKIPMDRAIDGRDLWPVLSGKSTMSPHNFFHYMGGSREGEANYLGIRDDRWKLMVNVDSSGVLVAKELYNLGTDVGERFNRLTQQPEIATRLRMEAQKFYDELSKNIRPAGQLSIASNN
ncbi:sulfatase [Arenibacter sp. ARW7G5Y1]|uniref:sulfatase family protein n=1 Tax=Arenibacter sp. ARW7G5Y1 TaxID=2135619 RepID=UPI000D75B606|nr:sulfatase [Arenibacter sp. ARW7G5Y1]PXX21484.1 arylsulfatase A [Arenibacter sp. ARW7G5Y1]